jgi:hypothetical protein
MKVKCVNNSSPFGSYSKNRLTIGKEYEMLREEKDGEGRYIWIAEDDKGIESAWFASRFEITGG